jgi:phosphatidylserine/phosphatidylglycerophosphate/cardiolipin synthase-like enzyme
MKIRIGLLTTAIALSSGSMAWASHLPEPRPIESPRTSGCELQFGFSPNQGAMDLVIKLIDSASRGQRIEVEAYEFTSHRMAHALHAALDRGATVRIAVDARENVGKAYSVAYQFVGAAGAEVRYEDHWPVFHDKVTLVRALSAVEEGSMNYTFAGDTKNRENATLMTNCPSAAQAYGADFDNLWAQGTPLR